MKGRRQACWRPALCAAGLMLLLPASAQNVPMVPPRVKLMSALTNVAPPLAQSPVSFFRQLLVMTPAERDRSLTIYPPQVRGRILAKVREYLALDPDERELRLDATELRWYLLPLLREPPTNRAVRLAQVPDNLRGLVLSRLEKWDALPPQTRQELLDNEETLRYFSHVDPANAAPASGAESGSWQTLSEADRRQITAVFDQLSTLTPDEEQAALNTLSVSERAQMEKTLQTFGQLPAAQRAQCIRAFTEFASMSPPERAEFLKNAARWSQMTPKERQAWRDLVAQVPLWPPMPHTFVMPPKPPPLPPRPPLRGQSLVATNHN